METYSRVRAGRALYDCHNDLVTTDSADGADLLEVITVRPSGETVILDNSKIMSPLQIPEYEEIGRVW